MNNVTLMIAIFVCGFAVLAPFASTLTTSPRKLIEFHQNKIFQRCLIVAAFLFAFLIRLVALDVLPAGLNQDEATIGYDAWCIANYGTDRYQSLLPVYPIGMGVGNGTFYAYFESLFIRIFGLSVFTHRYPNALLACFSCYCFYSICKRTRGTNFAITGLAIFAVTPVLITNARFAVDYTTQISLITITIYLLIESIEQKRLWLFILSGVAIAWISGSYGSMIAIVPMLFVLTCGYALLTKRITKKHLAILVSAYTIFCIPLACVILVNYFGVPPFKLFGIFSIDLFSSNYANDKFHKFDSLFVTHVTESLKSYLRMTIFQKDSGLIDAYIPKFGLTYYFTAPLIIFGMILACKNFRKLKEYKPEMLIVISWVSSTFFALFTSTTLQRLLTLFPVYIYFIALAIQYLYRRVYIILPIFVLFFVINSVSFTNYYFNDYKNDMGSFFFYSLDEAIEFATDKTDGEIYVTRTDLLVPEYVVLFYTRISPEEFSETVRFHNPSDPFRDIQRVSRFKFALPEEINPNLVYIISNYEIDLFNSDLFEIKQFEYYSVAYPK